MKTLLLCLLVGCLDTTTSTTIIEPAHVCGDEPQGPAYAVAIQNGTVTLYAQTFQAFLDYERELRSYIACQREALGE